MWNERLESIENEYLWKLAEGCYAGTKVQREGIVIRPMLEHELRGRRVSVKVMNLLYKG
jgi:hypothetical protein